ncbi:MAG: hypothetical protein HQL94_01440 [Magnetococcales bacterium]|nr:hypothetical protein [Magnetococcales bacterium]MBF0439043.1 hypothetical protein [Magnetococcales bacterium]
MLPAKQTMTVNSGTVGASPVAKAAPLVTGEIEAAEGTKAVAVKGGVTKGATGGKAALVSKNATLAGKKVALIGKPAAKGITVAATKTATGVGLTMTTWGPVLLAGILIASGTGIYYYLKKLGAKGELEEVSS